MLERALLGATKNPIYSAEYQRFQSEIDQAEEYDETMPSFVNLEQNLLKIDVGKRKDALPSKPQSKLN